MKKTKAFTLIEILIVVILLGVLAAVVVPNLTGSAEETRKTAEAASCKQIQQAATRYFLKNQTVPTVQELVDGKYLDMAPKSSIDSTKSFDIAPGAAAGDPIVVTSQSDNTIKYPN